jgi:hypothetical protein
LPDELAREFDQDKPFVQQTLQVFAEQPGAIACSSTRSWAPGVRSPRSMMDLERSR